MRSIISVGTTQLSVLLALAGFMISGVAISHDLGQQTQSHTDDRQASSMLMVSNKLLLPAEGVTDLKFQEIFKLPVGPNGLEASQKLIGLNGKRVQLVGYMAKEESPVADMFILCPLPVSMGDEDDSYADDLPASAVFVHLDDAVNGFVPYYHGLIRLTGLLQFGAKQEADGRVSTVRLLLDQSLSREILGNTSQHQAGSAGTNSTIDVATH